VERELWTELEAAIERASRDFFDEPDYEHPTESIVRVHLWSVLHDRPTCWATRASNWAAALLPPTLPSQPTMSRRLRSEAFERFMRALEPQLGGLPGAAEWKLFKRMDAKALTVAAHSTDRDARWGRGAGQKAKGYKLHVVWASGAMPEQWRVAPLDVSEQEMGRRMLRDLEGCGHVAADRNYDANRLFDQADESGHRLVAPRRYGEGKGLGHHRHSPGRLRSKDLLEKPTRRLTRFGPTMMKERGQIERDLGNLVSFGGGLTCLPPWARRHGRVRRWVWGKLLVNAARVRLKRRKSLSAA
jgi:hypothetical protein